MVLSVSTKTIKAQQPVALNIGSIEECSICLDKCNIIFCNNCNNYVHLKCIKKYISYNNCYINTENNNINLENQKYQKINKKIMEYQKFIKKNFEYVGENFAYEARSIHYNNKKKDKGIYGTASREEIKDLKDEGIDAEIIPLIENKNN